MASTLEAQFGMAEETTWGTRITPTVFLPFTQESISQNIGYLQSNAYRTGRIMPTVRRKSKSVVAGDIEMELAPQGLNLWMKYLIGNLVTTGAGPYTHTYTPTAPTGKGLTIQIGRTDNSGTMRPFDYTGCKVDKWELSSKVDSLAMLKTTISGQKEDTAQTLATASYPASLAPFSWTDASLTIGGTATPVRELTISADNGLLTDRFRMQSANPSLTAEQIITSIRAYTGTLIADFVDLTAYNRFVNQTAAALVVTFNAGASAQLVITANVEFDGKTPNMAGPGTETAQELPFVCLSGTDDPTAFTAVLTNSTATP